MGFFFSTILSYTFTDSSVKVHKLSAWLLLQPRSFKSKRRQKGRQLIQFSAFPRLLFGSCGLVLKRPLYLSGPKLSNLKSFIKKASRKGDKTRRFVWFNAFPHLPLTRKADNARMGKGKGKVKTWFTNLSGGLILLEFKNLRPGRAIYFMNQTAIRLGVPVKKLFKTNTLINFPLLISKKLTFRAFW